MLLANSKTITNDVTVTLPYTAFTIPSPCTKISSHTRLYNAATLSPSGPHKGDSLAIIAIYFTYKWLMLMSDIAC